MSEIVVYGASISPFVNKVQRALWFKGLTHELVPLKGPGDLKKWNPQTGKMPVLEWKGEKTFDSTVILRRLDQEVPQPPLFSSEPKIAASQRLLEDWSDESLYWYVMALRWIPLNARASVDQILSGAPIPGLMKAILRRSLSKRLAAMTRAQGLGRLPQDVLVKELGRDLDDLLLILGDDKFYYGEALSAADLSLRGMIASGTSGPTPEITRLVEERRGLVAWCERVDAVTKPPKPS